MRKGKRIRKGCLRDRDKCSTPCFTVATVLSLTSSAGLCGIFIDVQKTFHTKNEICPLTTIFLIPGHTYNDVWDTSWDTFPNHYRITNFINFVYQYVAFIWHFAVLVNVNMRSRYFSTNYSVHIEFHFRGLDCDLDFLRCSRDSAVLFVNRHKLKLQVQITRNIISLVKMNFRACLSIFKYPRDRNGYSQRVRG